MPIKVTIIEDATIRKQIKKMVEGQIKCLVREEVERQVKEIVEKKIKDLIEPYKIERAIMSYCRDTVNSTWNTDRLMKNEARSLIKKEQQEKIKQCMKNLDIDKLAREIVKESLRK